LASIFACCTSGNEYRCCPEDLADDDIAALPARLLDAHGEQFATPRRRRWSSPRGHDRGVSH
jgi:hypothetical protein